MISPKFFLFLILFLFIGAGCADDIGPDVSENPLGDAFDNYVQKGIEDFRIPGIAIGVVKEGKLIYSKGFGFRDIEQKLPVNADTLFAIGSTTKAFTATTLGILADDQKLKLDTPVVKILPDFELASTHATQKATLRDLLSHRVGLPRHDLVWYGSPYDRLEIFGRLKFLKFTAPLREKWQYQNMLYMVAGMVAGKVSESSWEKAVQERILDPLGMTRTNFSYKTSIQATNAI